MSTGALRITGKLPRLTGGRMVLAFSGWMDGGDVSTGTVRLLVRQLQAAEIARIEPGDFYIFNFPGAMEVAALFRPESNHEGGLIQSLDMPENVFFANEKENLILFVGREPNLQWPSFGDCVFELAQATGVTQITFVGSFAGGVPHTREPRLYGTVSDESLLPALQRFGVRPSSYHGPASFSTYLMSRAPRQGVQMFSFAAEIPGYVEGTNPPSIAAITKRLAVMLGLQVSLAELRDASDEWETRITAAVAKDPELEAQIKKLEERYDDDLIGKSTADEDDDGDEDEDEDDEEEEA
jgi:proteasome assembly chaperone (PAC2) family protein